MNDTFDRNELRALFGSLNDGTLSPEEHARLEKILADNAEARRLWYLHCDIETGLADWAASQGMAKIVPMPTVVQAPRRSPLWNWAVPLAAAAAVAQLAIVLGKEQKPAVPGEQMSKGVAVLSRAVGVEWVTGSEEAVTGAVLAPRTLRLKSGAALIEFYSGARVVVEGPAEFQLLSSSEGFLRSGKISAHVPPQARGFTVSSNGMKVVDFGTDFGIAANDGTAPEVHVFTGRVEVAAASTPVQSLTEGQAVRVEVDKLSSIPAKRDAFPSEEDLARRDAASAMERYTSWRQASEALSADPAAVIHYNFEEQAPTEGKLMNAVPGMPEGTNGSIVGSGWTQGRWPNKRALELRGEGDRVRLIAPEPQNEVTFLAWVRVVGLSYGVHSLLYTDAQQTGSLRWEITREGELRLAIGRDLKHPELDYEAIISRPFITGKRVGQWVLVASTFDGQTIRHYGNGRLIGSGPSFHPPSLHIGSADLGNWSGQSLRHLPADVDEFAVLSRAMSAEEIREYYLKGKP
jgi:hypothetical protein